MHQLLILFFNIIFHFIFISALLVCCKKKKQVGSSKAVGDDPPSKKCNTKGGLLADDPDLRSLELRKKAEAEQKKAAAEKQQSTCNVSMTNTKLTSVPGTDLRSLEDNGGPKKKDALPDAMSAYANPKTSGEQGMSMLAMVKVDKAKLTAKPAPKQPEVIAQDSTQADDSQKKDKTKSKKTQTASQCRSKKGDSVQGGDAAPKKKKNLENMLDAMMDKTQSLEKNNEDVKIEIAKTQIMEAAPQTKMGDCKTQVPTKLMDVSSRRSQKQRKAAAAAPASTKKTDEKKEKAKTSSKKR